MKLFIAVCAILATVAAKPSGIVVPYGAQLSITSPISSQFHIQDELGQYSYGYSTALSTKNEARTADGVTVGGYTYIDGEGKRQFVEYLANDVLGFRVAASNIPIPPAVPEAPVLPLPVPVEDTPEVVEARAKHLAAVEEVKARPTQVITPVTTFPALAVSPLIPIDPASPFAALRSAALTSGVEVKSAAAPAVEAKSATAATEAPSTQAPAAEAKSAILPADVELKSDAAPALAVNPLITPAVAVKSIVTPPLPVATAPLIAAPVAYSYSINTLQGLNSAIFTQPAITAYTVPLGAQLLAAPTSRLAAPAEKEPAAKEAKESSD